MCFYYYQYRAYLGKTFPKLAKKGENIDKLLTTLNKQNPQLVQFILNRFNSIQTKIQQNNTSIPPDLTQSEFNQLTQLDSSAESLVLCICFFS